MTNPEFIMFSRAKATCERGEWSFTLLPADGSAPVEVFDSEPGLRGERLELLSLVRGLEALEQPSRVTLYCESAHIRRRIENGLEVWRENDWQWERFGEMVPIANADLWRRIDRALHIHRVVCRMVRSAETAAPASPTGSATPRVSARAETISRSVSHPVLRPRQRETLSPCAARSPNETRRPARSARVGPSREAAQASGQATETRPRRKRPLAEKSMCAAWWEKLASLAAPLSGSAGSVYR